LGVGNWQLGVDTVSVRVHKTVVINVVGLTAAMLRSAPKIAAWANGGALATIRSAFPAVTCTAQADYLTGRYPDSHGIVGNGWYVRDDCEIRFWRQSNKLVRAPQIWEEARRRDARFTCANLFWWFNMYSTVEYSVTPRPMYPADGRKLPDVYTSPATLRDELQSQFGTFPLFNFWGPRASIEASRWIGESAKYVERQFSPTLTLIYIPHLDYNLQRVGPGADEAQRDVRQVDDLVHDLIHHFEHSGARVIVLSEYGLRDVSTPVHINRILRERGLIAVRVESGLELLDAGASAAFAVADHQIAHVYVNDEGRQPEVRQLLERTPGIDRILDAGGKREYHIDHNRSGDLIAIAGPDAWFTYYYWLDDERAPDFARTVDIHRKPGYDPVELFLDPAIRMPALSVGWKLARRQLGFRTLLDVIPLDATLVKGSHGRRTGIGDPDAPVLITKQRQLMSGTAVDSIEVSGVLLQHLFD
jgi:predicted AlkP superfamily pyrophosphatase or phosphodiesterase